MNEKYGFKSSGTQGSQEELTRSIELVKHAIFL